VPLASVVTMCLIPSGPSILKVASARGCGGVLSVTFTTRMAPNAVLVDATLVKLQTID
jgi:hypothetical protein